MDGVKGGLVDVGGQWGNSGGGSIQVGAEQSPQHLALFRVEFRRWHALRRMRVRHDRVVRDVQAGGLVDPVAQRLQLRLLHRIREPLVPPDAGEGGNPVAVGEESAVGGDEVRGGAGQQDGAGSHLRAQRLRQVPGQVLDPG